MSVVSVMVALKITDETPATAETSEKLTVADTGPSTGAGERVLNCRGGV